MANGKIYFDMDGVLADFDRGVTELLGLPVVDQKNKTPEQDDEMFETMRKLGHFYGKLEPMPGAVELLNKCWEKYGDRCEILTGIPKEKRGITDAGGTGILYTTAEEVWRILEDLDGGKR